MFAFSFTWLESKSCFSSSLSSIAKRRFFFSAELPDVVSPISGGLYWPNALCSPAPCRWLSNSVFSSRSDLRCSPQSSVSRTMSSNNTALSPCISVLPEGATLALTAARSSATLVLNLSWTIWWLGSWILSKDPSGDELRKIERADSNLS